MTNFSSNPGTRVESRLAPNAKPARVTLNALPVQQKLHSHRGSPIGLVLAVLLGISVAALAVLSCPASLQSIWGSL